MHASRKHPQIAKAEKICRRSEVRSAGRFFGDGRIKLREEAGVYAFWWIGERARLLKANRHIVLKGPGNTDLEVEYQDWWPTRLPHPCLYVGKTTNIKKRFSLHIKRRCEGRLHKIRVDNRKLKPCTTSCQLRYGIEHIFPKNKDPLETIFSSVGFSYTTDFPPEGVAERFYAEDWLIGSWRPWFNIDSER